MGKVRDFSAFKSVTLTPEQEEFLAKRDAMTEPPELDKGTIAFIKGVINRHGWLRSKVRQQAYQQARTARGIYQCAACKQGFSQKDTEIDHKFQRVQPNGPNTIEDYCRRTFTDASNLACLCKACHKICSAHDRNKA
jgi:hypothetical protein